MVRGTKRQFGAFCEKRRLLRRCFSLASSRRPPRLRPSSSLSKSSPYSSLPPSSSSFQANPPRRFQEPSPFLVLDPQHFHGHLRPAFDLRHPLPLLLSQPCLAPCLAVVKKPQTRQLVFLFALFPLLPLPSLPSPPVPSAPTVVQPLTMSSPSSTAAALALNCTFTPSWSKIVDCGSVTCPYSTSYITARQPR
jgi:hypothetical protein